MIFLELGNGEYEILDVEPEPNIDSDRKLAEQIYLHDRNCWQWLLNDREREKAKYRMKRFGFDCLPSGNDSIDPYHTNGWPVLAAQHEQNLREFARKNYRRYSFIGPYCHPIILDECRRINNEF